MAGILNKGGFKKGGKQTKSGKSAGPAHGYSSAYKTK